MKRPATPGQQAQGTAAPALVRAGGPAPGTTAFYAQVERPMLAVTYWFDPAETRVSGTVVIRFQGHRQGVGAKTRPGDQFVQDERVDDVRPDSGPISITTRVRGINAGEWNVSAKVLPPDLAGRGGRARASDAAAPTLYPSGWSWPHWSFRHRDESAPRLVKTTLEPFARVPGMVPLVWGATALIGFVLALTVQHALLARVGAPTAEALAISIIAIGAGLVGAQARFWLDHRREGRFGGWAVQGFLTVTGVVGTIALLAAGVPVGPFVDASAPGIFVGLAVGRIGCFFGGCCCGRPTSSRWAIWSSDQRVGRRRIPTQLLESAASIAIALGTVAAILAGIPLRGGVFVAALATYTLVRQGILHLRAERATFGLGGQMTAAAALVVLVGDLIYLGALAR